MGPMKVRTDLALEEHENILSGKNTQEVNGVSIEESYFSNCDTLISKVHIFSKNGAHLMNKPIGHYITLESGQLSETDTDYHKEIAKLLSKELIPLMRSHLKDNQNKVLAVGLGNMDVTADSLGPRVMNQLSVTRHMILEYGCDAYSGKHPLSVSSISPSVMAKTGMETAEIIKGIVSETNPDLLLVVDSLAARSIKRLTHTIQISDSGIQPGSGVGNHREGITQTSMGIPVISIGIPMVVDAATIISDFLRSIPQSNQIDCLNQAEISLRSLQNMYVTGKDIDAEVRILSFTISEALNHLFFHFY